MESEAIFDLECPLSHTHRNHDRVIAVSGKCFSPARTAFLVGARTRSQLSLAYRMLPRWIKIRIPFGEWENGALLRRGEILVLTTTRAVAVRPRHLA